MRLFLVLFLWDRETVQKPWTLIFWLLNGLSVLLYLSYCISITVKTVPETVKRMFQGP